MGFEYAGQEDHMQENFIFSIIIPMYNVENYISECIESILSQSYQNWEIILVNDGSTDRSAKIVESYAQQDSRIKIFSKENTGQADSRNFGVQRACGDYFLFVDSDDYIATDTLEMLYKEIKQWKDIDVILSEGMYSVFGEKTQLFKYWDCKEYCGLSGRNALLKTMRNAANWSPCGKCYKVSYWKEHGFSFQTGILAEDFELIDRTVLEAGCVSMVSTFYYYRRLRPNSTMTQKNKKLHHDELFNIIRWEKYFKEHNIDEELLSAFRSRFLETYCHGVLAYMYIYDKNERQKMLETAESIVFYFEYASNLEMKLVAAAYRFFGLPLTCAGLGIVKRMRKRYEALKAKS